ncbi:MAG TPA: PDC sensor domain-containing protein [Gammaproteobacteria bacterium]|nr:PDC sensor domain-containing protein [Gammaproteobacteria bacterium]
MSADQAIEPSWKDSIFRQREELARMLREPIARLAGRCGPPWESREGLNEVLQEGVSSIPYCTYLYAVGTDGIQRSDSVAYNGIVPGHYRRDRSGRPYMREAIPPWGFLLSDAYISLNAHRPSLTALQVVTREDETLGFLGADFDLRRLPVTSVLYYEPDHWRQVKGDPAIRSHLFEQTRTESLMDSNMEVAFSILEELLTERGIFQSQIHFSSSQATIWTLADPLRYRILDHEVLTDPDICLVYPAQPYPKDAVIPQADIPAILEAMRALRLADSTIYLRTASINIFNGMLSLTFSCDGSHYMRYDEFLAKGPAFWSGIASPG